MPTIASSIIPPPKSWEEFEEITLSATKLRWSSQAFFGNGRRGQRQDGVDIFGMIPDGRHVGVQCKNTISGLGELVIIKEIFNSELDPLRKFYKEWHRPERTFINAKLESIRLELWQRVDSYLNEVAIRTFSSIANPEWYSIPQDLEIQNPKLFWEIVNHLHSLAEEIVQLHRVLVLTAREYFFESS